MFIGHYAAAFAAAALPRAPRLAPMFVAAQLVDYVYFALVIAGVEHMRETPGHTVMNSGDFYHMPYTHSLLGTLGFAAAWAIGVRLTRGSWRSAWIGAAVVASHWPLDWLVHAPDLTLLGSGPRHGLALWDRPMVAMPLELGLLALAAVAYLSRTVARGTRSWLAPAVLLAALLALQLGDWLRAKPGAVIDPVPLSTPLTAIAAYTLFALLAWWTQATRTRPQPQGFTLVQDGA